MRESSAAEVTLVVVGRKARDFFRRRATTIKRDMIGFWDRLAYSHAVELADYFMQQYLDSEVDEVVLLYNEFRSVTMQRPVRVQLLPIPHGEVRSGRERGAGGLHLRAERRGDPRRSAAASRAHAGLSARSWNRWPASTAPA